MQNGGDAPAAVDTGNQTYNPRRDYEAVLPCESMETPGEQRPGHVPRPVYNRIPNFKGAPEAAAKLAELDVFKNADTVKVNPDKPQESVRVFSLEQQKTLYVPVPRLQTGFLNRLELPEGETGPAAIRKAVSRNGMETYGKPVGIEESGVSLDLVVMGSVAVSKEGYRIGKGKGYGDLEFGLMMHMKAIKPSTVVVTTVHDSQVFDTLPAELFGPHDVPIDIIITPTQVIETQRMSQRPTGILWHLLSSRRLALMPVLGQLRDTDMLSGRACPLKEVDTDVEERAQQARQRRLRRRTRSHKSQSEGEEVDTDVEERAQQARQRRLRRRTRSHKSQSEGEGGNTTEGENAKGDGKPRRVNRRRNSHKSASKDKDGTEPATPSKPRRKQKPRQEIDFSVKSASKDKDGTEPATPSKPRRKQKPRQEIDFSVKISNISPSTRVRDLKQALTERGVKPQAMIWKGFRGYCYLHFFKAGPQKGEGDTAAAGSIDQVIAQLQEMSVGGESADEKPRLLSVEPAPPRAPRDQPVDQPAD
ncbi:unnamed protein product [Plutella xylostella]|uniref:Methenyltetrahydrofolate synthase domain-containing protein n=1 Tax=Plutella xylostella TaxID=51655 RepID=A0A8S4G3A0_PLUXY|nr:unnamed protein product [Plutella xylostella]